MSDFFGESKEKIGSENGFTEGNETKTRKLLIGLFKNGKDLEKEDKAQVEQMIKEKLFHDCVF